MNLIEILVIVISFVNSSLSFGSFVRKVLDQISEEDPSSITTLTILRIDSFEDYKFVEDDIVHDIMAKVQPDYSVFYPPIMVNPDRFELTNRLGSLTLLISDLWENEVKKISECINSQIKIYIYVYPDIVVKASRNMYEIKTSINQ